MDPLLLASFGLLLIGVITSALIYRFGACKLAGTADYPVALGWSLVFTLFLCTFLSSAPFLAGQAPWLLILPFAGLSLSLLSIQRIVFSRFESEQNEPSH